ncbi:2-C-methyl-D-erythritol 4-phosphate cytidylyltransferase [Corynebacterium tapiri]|uniref:2-C-methyl-D-erythritol 4-phosphate cytidylyltransferase n=1 Tax=Corynebacterium tapiri TaxID=1448266 RepID=A0A5C4U1Z4_9CORY|nr:2-C-methyl-D-erythritol 4-phosphate cytidylyltransferase [Corynebacterium tapiri]TNL96060.1 2-C-methyl-D-erythritol 4-phosphate cytidylyltransferase [Corynebacterium tapiri]
MGGVLPVVAVVAAAGRGTRLGLDIPKAFVELAGSTLVERSVAALRESGMVDETIVVVSADMQEQARALFPDTQAVRLVQGRGERADSVMAGLEAIDHDEAIVLVHDAARALTPPDLVRRVVREVAEGAAGAIPVVPVADTIKQVDGTRVVATPDRSTLRAVQTPQGFQLAALREANLKYFGHPTPGFVATDDASLMELAGHTVHCVEGDARAFKVTTPWDLALAETIVHKELS